MIIGIAISPSSLNGGGIPRPPTGYQLLRGADGAYLKGKDGAYLYGRTK